MLIVSSDGINESPRAWLLGLEVVTEDPDDILAVPLGEQAWVTTSSLSRLYRGWLVECVGHAPPDAVESVDHALRAALDL